MDPPAHDPTTFYPGWKLPPHLPLQQLLREEYDWDFANALASNQPAPAPPTDTPPLALPVVPKTATIVYQVCEQWLRSGRCNTAHGTLNKKQAAYLLLIAAWLQETLNRSWGLPAATIPFRTSLLLGGPGSGKTYTTLLATELLHYFLPDSTLRAAFTHRAARLLAGHTLHSCLSLPLDLTDTSAKANSLGKKKDSLQAIWHNISTFLVDEVSMLSNEIFARMDLRVRQIFNAFATAWAGLAIRLSGDFHQLPPVAASCLIKPESTPPANANLTETQTQIAIGRDLWKNIDAVCILEHSHRCQGPLHTFLNDLTSDKGISTDSWQHLRARQLTSNDRRLQLTKFHPSRCPIGVLRHSVRALKTVQRAHEAAAACGHRLLLSIAADRCSSANRLFSLASDLALEAASIHTLSTTANLPNILALYPGIEVCLEAKLSAEIGVVRGCTCIDDYWIACLVLLSRVPQFDDILLLRLPDRAILARARPQYLQNAYQQFLAKEKQTLRSLDAILQQHNFDGLRQSITLPLLHTDSKPAVPPFQFQRRVLRK
eukprot:symbB.v1.2.003961.t1/scaffold170.1/size288889/7